MMSTARHVRNQEPVLTIPTAARSRFSPDGVDAAVHFQSSCAARRPRRRVPDEHADRRAARRVAGRRGAARSRRRDALATRRSARGARRARPARGERVPRRRTARPSAGRSTSTSRRSRRDTLRAERHGAHDAAVQLRVRLLLPGRPRRLQQVRREDVARDGGARRRLDRARARSRARPSGSCSRSSAASRC